MTTNRIKSALHRMALACTVDFLHAPGPLRELVMCCNCQGSEALEISYELIAQRWVVWCGCGNSSDAHGQLRLAIKDWNRRNA